MIDGISVALRPDDSNKLRSANWTGSKSGGGRRVAERRQEGRPLSRCTTFRALGFVSAEHSAAAALQAQVRLAASGRGPSSAAPLRRTGGCNDVIKHKYTAVGQLISTKLEGESRKMIAIKVVSVESTLKPGGWRKACHRQDGRRGSV